jgi:acyl carrier protein
MGDEINYQTVPHLEDILAILCGIFESSEILEYYSLREDLKLVSRLEDLAGQIKEVYKVSVSASDWEGIETVGELSDFIRKQLKERNKKEKK